MEIPALSLSRLVHIDWVIFERLKNGNHGRVGEGSYSSHVRVFIFARRAGIGVWETDCRDLGLWWS